MKNKLTIEQKINSKKIKNPPTTAYRVLGKIWKFLFFKKYGVKVTYKCDPRKESSPHIFISNHSSRNDYIFTAIPLLPNTYNFVAGYNEFYRSHLKGIFNFLNLIPKKNFTPDLYAMKEISRVIKNGGNVAIFPEGMNSIGGMSQPVAIGTGKFLKHFKVPVYYSVIKGGFLSFPKHTNNSYPGRVEVVFDKLFTVEDLERLSPEEIEDIVNEKLYHDDYKWNKLYRYTYKTRGLSAEGLSDVLFYCPKCGSQHSMASKGNTIWCTDCGNGATINDNYDLTPLDENCVIPETQSDWFNMQRELMKKTVKNPDFSFSSKVKLGTLPKYKYLKKSKTSNITGEGTLTIDKSGLTFKGINDQNPLEFHLNPSEVPTYGMCTDVSRFYTFVNGEFYEFYPETRCVEKFFLLTEELHRLNGGKWQDFKFDK